MERLKVEKFRYGSGLDNVRISGFQDGELAELKRMPHEDAKDKLIEMLDERNNKKGTEFACGYGIYGMWFDNEYAYLNIGSSCD